MTWRVEILIMYVLLSLSRLLSCLLLFTLQFIYNSFYGCVGYVVAFCTIHNANSPPPTKDINRMAEN